MCFEMGHSEGCLCNNLGREKITTTTKFVKGQKVYWNDPAEETSGEYTISFVINEEMVYISNGVSEAEVLINELEVIK